MKIIKLCFDQEDFEKYIIDISIDNDLELLINTNINEKFSDLKKDTSVLKENLLHQASIVKDASQLSSVVSPEEADYIESLDSDDSYNELFENVNTIRIYSDCINDIAQYLEKNPELNNYPIELSQEFKFDYNIASELYDKLGNYSNIKIRVEGNYDLITISEFKESVDKLNSMSEAIKKYNLSPLEQFIFAYDLVRERQYNKEDTSERATVSRDLTSVLIGDKIVCAGYTIILTYILEKLNILSQQYNILRRDNKEKGHSLLAIYLKDDKYNIDGIYLSDPTWDSQKDSNDYLKSYKYLLRTKKKSEDLQQYKYNSESLANINLSDIIEHLKSIQGDNIFEIMTKYFNIPQKILESLNYLSHLVDDKSFIKPPYIDYLECIERAKKYIGLLTNPIDIHTLFNAILNVRKIEYYENPEKYPFDVKTMEAIFESLQGITQEEKLMNEIFGLTPKAVVEEKEIEKEIAQIKLTKTLQKIAKRNN